MDRKAMSSPTHSKLMKQRWRERREEMLAQVQNISHAPRLTNPRIQAEREWRKQRTVRLKRLAVQQPIRYETLS